MEDPMEPHGPSTLLALRVRKHVEGTPAAQNEIQMGTSRQRYFSGFKLMRPPAIVTYMGYSGLGIVRSLGRRGIPVFTLDPSLAEIGMSSRFCNARQCPAINKSEDGNLTFLLTLARSFPEKPVLYPTSDNVLHGYARHEDVLKPHIRLTTPGSDIIRRTAAKDALFHTARECGM